ncbi:MAG: type II toxin-antitoxin system VapC family toxin [Armatimonadetes bacterium]|nr:type II toxin-antitoxin system VapC family toxin [Anaerolineae bacterium]
MRCLIDTHTFIWLDTQPERLSARVATFIADDFNTIFLSHISIWELQIKIQLGKLQLSKSLVDSLETQRQNNQLELLTVELAHILTLDKLPFHHRDPFDRLLIAQAMAEGLPLISRDSVFSQYPIKVIW